jgi:predicted DNA-binding transcriptional regulator YafY
MKLLNVFNSKIAAVVPKRLRSFVAEPSSGVPTSQSLAVEGLDIARTRLWIRSGRKIRIRYKDERSRETERTIWPTIIGYAETVRLLAAWCELRQGFQGCACIIQDTGKFRPGFERSSMSLKRWPPGASRRSCRAAG